MRSLLIQYFSGSKYSVMLLAVGIIMTRVLDALILISFSRVFEHTNESLYYFFYVSALIGFVLLTKYISGHFSLKLGVMVLSRFTIYLQKLFFHSSLRSRQKYSLSDLHQIINTDTRDIAHFFSSFLVSLFSSVIFIGIVSVYVFINYGLLGYIFVFIIINMTLFLSFLGRKLEKRWLAKKESFVALSSVIENFSAPTQDIHQFFKKEHVEKTLKNRLDKYHQVEFSAIMGGYHLWILSLFFMNFGKIAILIIGIYFFNLGYFTMGQLIGLVAIFDMLEESIMYLRYQLEDLPVIRSSTERISHFISNLEPLSFGVKTIESLEQISIQGFSKTYEQVKITTSDTTFVKGDWVRVTGASGIGKTTFLRCLLNFENHGQTIFFNGIENATLSKEWFESNTLYLAQNIDLFYTTPTDYLNIHNACQRNEVEAFVGAPVKWDSNLTEKGQQLSSGELQLLILSKALSCHQQLVVIDEMTAYLDDENEDKFFSALKRRKIFLFFVSHKTRAFDFFTTPLHLEKREVTKDVSTMD